MYVMDGRRENKNQIKILKKNSWIPPPQIYLSDEEITDLD
jgi:hypothetical protein